MKSCILFSVLLLVIVFNFLGQYNCVSFTEFYDDFNGYLVISDNTTVDITSGVTLTTNAT